MSTKIAAWACGCVAEGGEVAALGVLGAGAECSDCAAMRVQAEAERAEREATWKAQVRAPRDATELQERFGSLIAKRCENRNRIAQDLPDVQQNAFLQLIVPREQKRDPEACKRAALDAYDDRLLSELTVSSLELCQMLGVSLEQLYRAHERCESWIILPFNVLELADFSPACLEAQYALEDVLRFLEAHEFEPCAQDVGPSGELLGPTREDLIVLPARLLGTESRFVSYLQSTLSATWSNWCRRKGRRHKERPQPDHGAADSGAPWAECLPDPAAATAIEAQMLLSEGRAALRTALAGVLGERDARVALDSLQAGETLEISFAHVGPSRRRRALAAAKSLRLG